MNNQIIYSPTYRNYPINTQNGTMGCYDKTLEKIYNILLGANKRHARIIVVRFDLHYPLNMIPPQDNHLFSNMMRNFMEKLRISDASNFVGYILCNLVLRQYEYSSGTKSRFRIRSRWLLNSGVTSS